MRWTTGWLPCGTEVAHLSCDLCLGGAHLLTWTNGRVPRGTWLLRWLNQRLPCVSVWWSSCSCGPFTCCHVADVVMWPVMWTYIGEVDQWDVDTWHCHAEVAQWGVDTWHPLSLLWFCVCMFEIPSLHPDESLSPSYTQMNPWLNLSPWFPFLIYFIFSEFILIAPIIQKSWNFYQKIPNSWWSPL
jgi:hypothetical protein